MRRKSIIHVSKSGSLTSEGYKPKNSLKLRRKSLRKAIKNSGRKSTISLLTTIKSVQKYLNPFLVKNISSDIKWVKSLHMSKSPKRSRRKKSHPKV